MNKIEHDAIQAVIFKCQMPEAQREQLNEAGSWSAFIWGDPYLDIKQISQNNTTGLSASLYLLEASSFYPIDSIWDLSQVTQERDFMTYGDHLNYLFHIDNVERHSHPAIWRKEHSPSLSVGDVVAFTEFDREEDEPVVYLVANIGFIQLSKPQAKIFKNRTRNHAWIKWKKHQKAAQAA
jgi:hypothetical protein